MSETDDPLLDIAMLAAHVLDAACTWCRENPPGLGEIFVDELRPLRDAVEAFQAACMPRTLRWAQVPAGWEVQAPDGQWYEVTATRQTPGHGAQIVTMLGKDWSRDPGTEVTARPGIPNPTDVAIAALGFPTILEDGK